MFVHIMPLSSYSKKFINFIGKHFNSTDQVFIYFSRRLPKDETIHNPSVELLSLDNPMNIITLLSILKKSAHVFVHGLFDPRILFLLSVFRGMLRKSTWILWGGDLYNYWLKEEHTLRSNILESLKRSTIKNFQYIAAFLEEDYRFACQRYKTTAKYRYVFYPNPVDHEIIDDAMIQVGKKPKFRIMIGNSATITNNHINVLERLKKLSLGEFEIICPLSYGDKEYANSVIRYGKRLFGDNFIELVDFLEPREYAKILASIDVAIFAHKRQQGLGNILALLYARKKVYIRSDVSTWNFLHRHGIVVFDTIKVLSGKDSGLFRFDEKIGERNREIVKREFSEERCVQLWKNFFDEIIKTSYKKRGGGFV